MINWLLEQTMIVSLIIFFLIATRSLLSRGQGASGYYALWLLVPLSMLLSPLVLLQPLVMDNQVVQYVVAAKYVSQSITRVASVADEHAWLAILWLTGAMLVFISVLLHYNHNVKALKLHQFPSVQSRWKTTTPLPKGLRFAYSNKLSSPLIFGFIKGCIVLPAQCSNQYTQQQLQLMLQHEQQHFKRGDLIWNWLAVIFVSLFWFNPLVWLGYKSFRAAQELACDQAVLSGQTKASRIAYGKAMLQAALSANAQTFTQLNYQGKSVMKIRLAQLKHHKQTPLWRTLPSASIVLLTIVGINLATAGGYEVSHQLVPQAKFRLNPVFPQAALSKGVGGRVLLEFNIASDGRVKEVSIEKSDHNGMFDQAALAAVQSWVYHKPSQEVVDVKVQLTFVNPNPYQSSATGANYASDIEIIQVAGTD